MQIWGIFNLWGIIMAAQEKPWGGRFKEATSKKVEAYTESISFDTKMYKQDIMGSKAHAVMLAEQGILKRLKYYAAVLIVFLKKLKAENLCGNKNLKMCI